MTIKSTILSRDQVRAKIGLDGIFKISNTELLQKKQNLRDELEKDTLVYLDQYKRLLTQIRKVFVNNSENINDFINKSEARDRIKINAIVRAYKQLDDGLKKSGQQGHIEVGTISKQLLILYTRLDEMSDIAASGGRAPYVPKPTAPDITTKEDEVRVVNVKRDAATVKRIAEEIRTLYIMSKAVDELDNDTVERLIKKGSNPLEITRKALDDYLSKGQTHHTIQKSKTVNIITGEATQKIGLESKDVNDFKGSASYLIGIGRNESLNAKVENQVLTEIQKDYGDKITKISGSKPLETEIVDQIMTLASGKKTKRYRSNTVHKKSIKGNKKTKLSTAIGTVIVAQQLAKKGLPRLTVSPKKDKGESGRGDPTNRSINKLRMKINQRLPAEVRRNMGRPALINQTGRFSNSVTLTELRQGPKTLVGKYTYMLSPYETFENEGPRQWPTGYNPKTLITKSIRNLAMQYTEQKFTLRKE